MASTPTLIPPATTDGAAGAVTAHRGGPVRWIVLAALPPVLLALFWRVWQQLFAFEHGLDSTLPGFQRYWLSIFALNTVVLPMLVAVAYARLWWTGRELQDQPMDDATEVRRIWTLWLLLLSFAVASYLGGSYFTEQDAAWHQVTLRDTTFTPSHIGLFYGAFPMMLYLAAGAYLYARTRLSHMFGGKGHSVPFVLMIGGTVLLLFQVAFNEFGHTFWETEEIFNAPLHWPFVFFAYFLGGTGAVLIQTLPRLYELTTTELSAAGAAVRDGRGLLRLGRRWDFVAVGIIAAILAASTHMESTLFAGEWSFWVDWKDRQWWPLVTPAANIILAATAQHVLWKRFRVPIGATTAAVVLVLAQWVSRTATFELWANLPLNMTWPETLVLLAVLMDATLVLSRSLIITSLVGAGLWGGLFWVANYPLIAAFHQPVILDGQVLTIADVIAFQFPRSQGPEYLRMIEEGHLRALVGNVTVIVSFFAAMLSAAAYWVGVAIGELVVLRPIGRMMRLQSDTDIDGRSGRTDLEVPA